MPLEDCHAPAIPADARDLLLRVLGVARVAAWCGVGEAAVYQWLHRGTSDAPVPFLRVPAIARGASAAGLDFDLGLISPSMAGWTAAMFSAVGGAPSKTASSAAALGNSRGQHPVTQAYAVESASCGDAVVGSAVGDAKNRPAHGDASQSVTGGVAAGFAEFASSEVRKPDLDPPIAPDPAESFHAQAVAVTDIDDGSGKGATSGQFGRHSPAVGNACARVREGWPSERQQSGCGEDVAKHDRMVAGRRGCVQ